MKKIVLALFVMANLGFANPLNNLTVGEIEGGINSGFDFIESVFDRLDKLSRGNLSKCYPKPQKPTVDICQMIPNDIGFGMDICSKLPGATGSREYDINGSEYLKKYCNADPKKQDGGGTIGGVNNGSKEVGKRTGKYKGGQTPKEYYGKAGNGSLRKIIEDKSVANTAFLQDNQEILQELGEYAKNSGKNINDVTIDDIVSTIPATQDGYFEEREALTDSHISDLLTYSPYNLSTTFENELQGLQNTVAQNRARAITTEALEALERGKEIREAFELRLNRKKDDIAYANKEMVDLLRHDNKIEAVIKIKNQLYREAKTLEKIRLENDNRKNLILLTEQKALIMNEKFDRAKARAEIQALIK